METSQNFHLLERPGNAPGIPSEPMARIAYVFSGQGDQHPGMGKEFFETYPAAAKVWALCDQIRPGTSAQCFAGTAEELMHTANTQPCLFAMELAAAQILKEKGLRPDAVAGFSLGEVAAATAAGIFDLETGFRLVCKRGQLMQQEAEKFDTAMAAVVKLNAKQVTELYARRQQVYPVNFNCPGNITVSGLASQMPGLAADVKAAGGRALPLKVKGAFHSPFMAEAAKAFAVELEAAEIRKNPIPLYANLTALPYGENAAELLSRQICSPVKWEQTIRNMIADGIDTFVEIGPGRTLTNMIKKIDPTVKALTVTDYLEEAVC